MLEIGRKGGGEPTASGILPHLPPIACIVGAPRCGTTSLARVLATHPKVGFSKVKEPHFFSRFDLNSLGDEELREVATGEYLARYFPDIPESAELLAEGSVSYLYAADRMRPLLRLWPEAKFIIALRDPLELLPSLHQRLLFQGDETVRDFAEAWRLQGQRELGRRIPRRCADARQLQYAEVARLGKHVQHFLAAVGRERCHIILHEDLAADPGAVYRGLLAFLGLPDDGRREFEPRRVRFGFKIGWLQRLLKRPPVATRLLAGEQYHRRVSARPPREPSPLSTMLMAARKRLLRWNAVPAPRTDIPPELKVEIRDLLSDDVALLSALIGRNLDHWLGGIAASRPVPTPEDQPIFFPGKARSRMQSLTSKR
jgi:hypothetical protein